MGGARLKRAMPSNALWLRQQFCVQYWAQGFELKSAAQMTAIRIAARQVSSFGMSQTRVPELSSGWQGGCDLSAKYQGCRGSRGHCKVPFPLNFRTDAFRAAVFPSRAIAGLEPGVFGRLPSIG